MKESQNQCQFPPFTISTDTSSLSCAIRLNPQDLGATHQHQEITTDLLAVGGSTSQPVLEHSTNGTCNQHIGEGHAQRSAKWMSSKMRLMRKMLGTDQIHVNKQRRSHSLQEQAQPIQASSSNSPTDIIRVCSNCKTTKTPLWRSGPQGPKSLCNACGIRQMKARRAMRAAAAAGLSSRIIPVADCKTQEERRSDVDRTVPFKKRFKIVTSASSSSSSSSSQKKKLQFDDITISLSKKLAFHQTCPQEEKEAAILLMALSCGLIHG